jgi:hypothetical protein
MVHKTTIINCIPLLVGIVLVAAGMAKSADPITLRTALAWNGIPGSWVSNVALLIVQVEIVLGLAMLFRVSERATTIIAIVMFIVFSLQLGYFLTSASPPSCGCLGKLRLFENTRNETLFGLFRNILILGGLIMFYRRRCGIPR